MLGSSYIFRDLVTYLTLFTDLVLDNITQYIYSASEGWVVSFVGGSTGLIRNMNTLLYWMVGLLAPTIGYVCVCMYIYSSSYFLRIGSLGDIQYMTNQKTENEGLVKYGFHSCQLIFSELF